MLMLSSLLRFRLVDGQQKTYHVEDFAIQLSAEAYPPVTGLLYREPGKMPGQGAMLLPWSAVEGWDEAHRRIRAGQLDKSQPAGADWLEKAVLLKRDILDAIVIDLPARSPVLANDLLLEKQGEKLLLKAVDIGLAAILRRLSGGLVRTVHPAALRDWNAVEFLRGNPQAARSGLEYHRLIERLPSGDIAYLADFLPYLYVAELLTLLPEPTAADTLETMIPSLQIQAFEELEPKKAHRLLALMRPDIIADLLSRLDTQKAREFLDQLPRDLRERVLQLLAYPDDTAGGIMTNDMTVLPGSTTAARAFSYLVDRLKSPAYQNILQFIYVVDSPSGQKLRGALTLRDLLIASGNSRLDTLMNPSLVTLSPGLPAHKAARRVIESGLTAVPVTAQDGRLLGVVTVDTALALTVPKTGGREIFRLYT